MQSAVEVRHFLIVLAAITVVDPEREAVLFVVKREVGHIFRILRQLAVRRAGLAGGLIGVDVIERTTRSRRNMDRAFSDRSRRRNTEAVQYRPQILQLVVACKLEAVEIAAVSVHILRDRAFEGRRRQPRIGSGGVIEALEVGFRFALVDIAFQMLEKGFDLQAITRLEVTLVGEFHIIRNPGLQCRVGDAAAKLGARRRGVRVVDGITGTRGATQLIEARPGQRPVGAKTEVLIVALVPCQVEARQEFPVVGARRRGGVDEDGRVVRIGQRGRCHSLRGVDRLKTEIARQGLARERGIYLGLDIGRDHTFADPPVDEGRPIAAAGRALVGDRTVEAAIIGRFRIDAHHARQTENAQIGRARGQVGWNRRRFVAVEQIELVLDDVVVLLADAGGHAEFDAADWAGHLLGQ